MAAREGRSDFLQINNAATDGGPLEAANFISETVAELAQLSMRHKLSMLGYLLDMVQLEADEIVRRGLTPGKF
jgi:hypothetical protein